ncbi:penicillin acylase family protein [Rhodospirillum centenum]|uniref:Penicillin acylase II, putative n=1 Tax=Rhodospirillum centenum (strain ATCC 51521 / SW) TaxID=414684 RepID=B6IMU7_RHOCS|nr:penicillin acylase family protein [Rhodospirillum centenum]ACI98763.1 penicillin acylase II, putative [Rhodospirillum centenum SW]
MGLLRRAGRFLLVLPLIVLSVAGGALALLFGALSLWQPGRDGEVALPGLSAPVEVVHDAHGVPHLFAATETDAYRVLGWLHARDRLAQMEAQRRIGAGRTAEIVGSPALPLDRFMRTLGLYSQAERAYETLPPPVRAAVDAYTEGVNAWLERPTGPLPVEFWLLWHRPEPWRPADTLVYGKLMSLLGGSWRNDLRRAALLEKLGPERLADLFPDDPPDAPATLAAADGVDWVRLAAALSGLLPEEGAASNWWALAGSRTASGRPILVNDPHLNIQVPSQWYLARIVTPDLTLAGAFAPGVPFLIMGHNRHVAWGFTTPYSDTEDLFVLPADTPGVAVRTETIGVRFGRTVQHRVRVAAQGPVLSDITDAAAEAAGPGRMVALASAALREADPNVAATWALNHARSVAEAREALKDYAAPHQNVVLADTEGHIGFVSAGLIPVREGFDGRLPVAAEAGRWTGFVPFEALPQAVDPPDGLLVNANNRVVPAGRPDPLGGDAAEPWRAARILDLLEGRRVHDIAGQEAILADILSKPAQALLPYLTALPPEMPLEADALAQLRTWDGRMRADRPEPLIFEWWLKEVHAALLRDELGDLYAGGLDARLVLHLLRDRPDWCDDTGTPVREDCAAIVRRALRSTLETLKERHGPHLVAWNWGWEHRVETGHALLARVPVLSWWFSRMHATDGGFYTVNRAGGSGTGERRPFQHVHGAVFRGLYDLADLDRSRFAVLGGPSGDPLSPWFDTLTPVWAAGRHVTLAGDAAALAPAARGRELFRP